MAELVYDKTGRLLFTKEMKKEYKILAPNMLPVHFKLLVSMLRLEGYDIDVLETSGPAIIDEGLRYMHNDTCYPALLVVGQFLDALKRGGYDLNKTALMITQTGGGCRASNYIHLLRKALKAVGMAHVPVISVNISGMEKNPGFRLTVRSMQRILYAIVYGDLLMLLHNRCRSYETVPGTSAALVQKWADLLTTESRDPKNLKYTHVKANFQRIVDDFATVPLHIVPRVRVGVVGEIYIKYAPLGNNNLEDFLLSEGAEVIVPGLLDFIMFKADNRSTDVGLYGGLHAKRALFDYVIKKMEKVKADMIAAVRTCGHFEAPSSFAHLKKLVGDYVGYGNKMGEGWLLTGEMLELIESGAPNIVCTQPFGCLPNHISGKGMIRLIRKRNPEANIVAIDYDPGATRVNQENRIRLMLSTARERLFGVPAAAGGETERPAAQSAAGGGELA